MKETGMPTSMARLALAGTFVAELASVAAAQDPVKKGQELFTSQKCAMCHSVTGVRNKIPAPRCRRQTQRGRPQGVAVNPDVMHARKRNRSR